MRKARIANPGRGKGKRGGFRYLYLYLEGRQHVHLLFLLDKDEQEDLTAEERKRVRTTVDELKLGEPEMNMSKKTKVKIFDDLHEGLQDALAFERREAVDLRVIEMPNPPKKMKPKDIRIIRRQLNATQVMFASYLNVSANTVRSWEQGTRRPQGADLKLLAIAKKNPRALLQ